MVTDEYGSDEVAYWVNGGSVWWCVGGGGSLIPVGSDLTMERDHFDPFINGIKIR